MGDTVYVLKTVRFAYTLCEYGKQLNDGTNPRLVYGHIQMCGQCQFVKSTSDPIAVIGDVPNEEKPLEPEG